MQCVEKDFTAGVVPGGHTYVFVGWMSDLVNIEFRLAGNSI